MLSSVAPIEIESLHCARGPLEVPLVTARRGQVRLVAAVLGHPNLPRPGCRALRAQHEVQVNAAL